MDDDGIGLADALEVLRSELAMARASAAGRSIQFPIEKLTVEMKAGFTRTVEGKAGFKVPFIGAELGGGGNRGDQSMQTVTLVLGPPVNKYGEVVQVASPSEEEKE